MRDHTLSHRLVAPALLLLAAACATAIETPSTALAPVKQKKLALVELLGRDCDGEPDQAPPVERWPRLFPRR